MTKMKKYILFSAVFIFGLLLTPFVSESPDGLEATLEVFNVELEQLPVLFNTPVQDYSAPGITSSFLSVIAAGAFGTILCFSFGIAAAKSLRHISKYKAESHDTE
ncbi:hypothetical protein ACFL6I_02050 [candidate division KSB1 bacterium]